MCISFKNTLFEIVLIVVVLIITLNVDNKNEEHEDKNTYIEIIVNHS